MMRVEVRPELLRWARERSGLDMAAFGRRFPHLDAWERGETRAEAARRLRQGHSYARGLPVPTGAARRTDAYPGTSVPSRTSVSATRAPTC